MSRHANTPARGRALVPAKRAVSTTVCVVAALFSSVGNAAEPHPFHVSMAEIEYNPASKSLEVALKLYAVDAEQALRLIRAKDVKFDFDNEAQRDKLLKRYLPPRFSVRIDKKQAKPAPPKIDPVSGRAIAPSRIAKKPTMSTFRYVGSEVDGAWVWAYFELPVGISNGQFELSNTVLTEIQLEQLNVVAFTPPKGRKQTIYFDRKKPSQTIALNEMREKPREK